LVRRRAQIPQSEPDPSNRRPARRRTKFDGRGAINGVNVRCEAPAWSLRWHTGYPARPIDFHAVDRLCEMFDLELPQDFGSLEVVPPER
jgi:hypothetical protein